MSKEIYTSSQLFRIGYRPSIDSALSVSRVGSTAQFRLMKKLVGTIKNDLTNYRSYIYSDSLNTDTNTGTSINTEISLLRVKGSALESIFYQD